jgi:hypothetical protein
MRRPASLQPLLVSVCQKPVAEPTTVSKHWIPRMLEEMVLHLALKHLI